MNGKTISILIIALVIGGAFFMMSKSGGKRQSTGVKVKIPVLSAVAQTGQSLFQNHCAVCHGMSAGGTRMGPPLIHKIYEPNHHADGAFYRAAANGVRAHHWHFGNMPPVRSASQQDVSKIIAFVREVQKANGIF